MTKVSLQNAAGSHRHAALPQYERSHADLYITPAEAVERLYRARPHLKSVKVWDSSAGLGHIVKACFDAGGWCIGTELHEHDHDTVMPVAVGIDLLTLSVPYEKTCIVNPPYNQAAQHIRHMLGLGCTVHAILRFNFITAKNRAHLLPHLREILMTGRTRMLPPGVPDKGMQPSIDYAWFTFTPERKDGHAVIIERA